jgi:hypothetical protein
MFERYYFQFYIIEKMAIEIKIQSILNNKNYFKNHFKFFEYIFHANTMFQSILIVFFKI